MLWMNRCVITVRASSALRAMRRTFAETQTACSTTANSAGIAFITALDPGVWNTAPLFAWETRPRFFPVHHITAVAAQEDSAVPHRLATSAPLSCNRIRTMEDTKRLLRCFQQVDLLLRKSVITPLSPHGSASAHDLDQFLCLDIPCRNVSILRIVFTEATDPCYRFSFLVLFYRHSSHQYGDACSVVNNSYSRFLSLPRFYQIFQVINGFSSPFSLTTFFFSIITHFVSLQVVFISVSYSRFHSIVDRVVAVEILSFQSQ